MSKTHKIDLCIIGTGPAGIILALEFALKCPDSRVVLVEFGKNDSKGRNKLDDSIIINNLQNHHDPYECTNKGFGGTSATWGGRCVIFDEIDFMSRPVLGNDCTWDLELFKELKKYTQKSADYFECGSDKFNLNEIEALRNTRIAENFKSENVNDACIERWSMPTRFGKRYSGELNNMPNIEIMEDYEAYGFSEPDIDGKVNELKIRSRKNGELTTLKAGDFVLAAGAMESTRLLLLNKHLFGRLGDVPKALGSYYQGHISGKIASVRFFGDPKKTDYGFMKDADGTYIRRRFQFSTDFLIKSDLLNTAIWLDNPLYHDPKHRNGAMSLIYLAMISPVLGKRLAPPAIKHSITKGKKISVWPHLFNILKDFPGSLLIPAGIFYRRYFLKRKLPGVFLYNPANEYALHFHAEQLPDKENRMSVDEDGSTLLINYGINEKDIDSVIQLHQELDKCLQQSGCGKLEYWYPEDQLREVIRNNSRDGIHQSGTTRIADSPENGVVDRNLKLFGTENVYVCSSSVFPTSGQANPTFLLGAFSVRLAAFLSDKKRN